MGQARRSDPWVIAGTLVVAIGGLGGCGERNPGPADSSNGGLRVSGAITVADRAASVKLGAAGFRATPAGFAATSAAHRLELRGALTRMERVTAPRDRWKGLVAPPALELETVSIARTGYECVTAGARLALASDGAAERRFGSCSERWTSGAQAGQVDFHFAARPAGSGDLTIAVRAQLGAAAEPMAVTSDARGLHFGAAGAGFRFGHGTWIDAAGTRTAVAARWTGTTIQLSVPAAILENSRYPAVLDPVVGPDLGTDTPVLVPASAGLDPDIGFDGTNFLVTFEDQQRIRAVRVDSAGNVLDFDWIDFGEDGMLQFTPNVAFGAGHYLVTWWQDDGVNLSIRGRLLDSAGNLIGSTSFPISSDDSLYAAVAWTGDSFLVGWSSLGASPGVHVAIVDASGALVAGSERQVSASGSAFKPRIAAAGATQSLIAWEDQSDPNNFTTKIRASRIAHDGTVLDPVAIAPDSTADAEDHAGIATDGQSFLLVWHRSGAPGTVEGAVIGPDGTIVAPEFSISRSSTETSLPSVAFDGAQYLVGWQDERDVPGVFGAEVTTSGTVLGTADTQLASVPIQPTFDRTALAWNGGHFLLAYLGTRTVTNGPSISGISGSLIAPDLSITADSLSFASLPNSQVPSTAAWNGRNYLVTWIDDRNLAFDQDTARGVLISNGGQVLDPAGIAVSGTGSAISESVASIGSGRSLVAWTTPTGQGLVRAVANNGTLGPIRSLAPNGFSPASPVVSNGSDYFVLLQRTNADGQHIDLFGTRLGNNGNPGPVFPIQQLVDTSGVSAIVAGTDYLVSFSQSGNQFVTINNRGRVSAAAASPIDSTLLTGATNGRNNTLVSWTDSSGQVLARFFARGAFRGPTLTIAPSSDGFPPAIAFDGTRYWIVWAADFETELPLLSSVDVDGTQGATSSVANEGCEDPALASDGGAQLLLTCFHFLDNFRVIRISTRLIDTSSTTAVAASN